MANLERTTVVGVFERRDQAECALEGLRSAGFGDDRIGVAMRNEEGMAPGGTETKAGKGAATGAVTGGVVGGLLGAAASLLIPGVGPVLAAGILATTLAGAAGGAVAGGLIGALLGMGVPEEEARYYDHEFQAGRVIVTARADNRYQEAFSILRDCGSYDVNTRPQGTTAYATGHQSVEGNPRIPAPPQSYEGNPRTPRESQTYEGYNPNAEGALPRDEGKAQSALPHDRTTARPQDPDRLYGTEAEPQDPSYTVYGTEPDTEPSDTVYGTEPEREKSETVYGTEAPEEEEEDTGNS